MVSRRFVLGSLVILLRSGLGLAANATAVTSDGCLDPTSFNACLQTAQTDRNQCVVVGSAGLDVQDALVACGDVFTEAQINCYLSDCWNKVYSCEYQVLAIEALSDFVAPLSVPFFPAPDNAPGGCSCNLGKLLTTVNAYHNHTETECAFSSTMNTVAGIGACNCCGGSAELSS
jgi:hypothetical protein